MMIMLFVLQLPHLTQRDTSLRPRTCTLAVRKMLRSSCNRGGTTATAFSACAPAPDSPAHSAVHVIRWCVKVNLQVL